MVISFALRTLHDERCEAIDLSRLFFNNRKDSHQEECQPRAEKSGTNRDENALVHGIGHGLGTNCHEDPCGCESNEGHGGSSDQVFGIHFCLLFSLHTQMYVNRVKKYGFDSGLTKYSALFNQRFTSADL